MLLKFFGIWILVLLQLTVLFRSKSDASLPKILIYKDTELFCAGDQKHSVLVKYFYKSQSSSSSHGTGLKSGISYTQFCECLIY